MAKKIAVYGSYEAKVHVRQRYWKHRRGCITQRYWKKTKRMKRVVGKGRYEFYVKGRGLYKAVVKAHKFMPKYFVTVSAEDFVTVSAEEFVRHPERYGFEGEWVEREVES